MFYTYILQSKKDETHYVGYTANLQKRLKIHNQGKVKYTKGHLPYTVIYFEEYSSKKEAKDREKIIKSTKNIKYFLKKHAGSPDGPKC